MEGKTLKRAFFSSLLQWYFFLRAELDSLVLKPGNFFLCFADVREAIGILNNYLEEGRSMRAALPFSVNHTLDYESNPMIMIMIIIAIITVVV